MKDLETPASGVEWLRREQQYYNRKYGQQKSEKAVQMARAVVHIRQAFGDDLSGANKLSVNRLGEV